MLVHSKRYAVGLRASKQLSQNTWFCLQVTVFAAKVLGERLASAWQAL